MSQWVPESNPLTPSQENPLSAEGGALGSSPQLGSPSRVPSWAESVPFFLSAIFFLSAFFVLFSPLPLLFVHLRKGRKWALIAALTNAVLVGLAGGALSLIFFLVFAVTLALTLAEFVKSKRSLEKSTLYTLLSMALVAALCGSIYAQVHHLNVFQELRGQVSNFVDYLGQSVASKSVIVDPTELEEWKKSLIVEFPSGVAVFSLILVWANLVLLLRVNPNGIREKLGLDAAFLRKWKAPEYLVWPTIAAGFFLVKDLGVATSVALNIFKFLMAIYAIQGLSIVSHFFDLWKLRGFLRVLGFSMLLFLMLPLVLSLGFFDLWFDFRSKFRQS